MGFQTKEDVTYAGIYDGNFVIRTKEGDANAVPRVIEKTGETIYELQYKTYDGWLKDAYVSSHEMPDGKKFHSLKLVFDDNGEKTILSIALKSRPATAFFQTMEAIDPAKKVELGVWTYKERNYMSVSQDGEKFAFKYTKENPQGKPDWTVTEDIDGNPKYDQTEELKFFKGILEKTVRPRLQAALLSSQPAGDPLGYVDVDKNNKPVEQQTDPAPTAEEELPF